MPRSRVNSGPEPHAAQFWPLTLGAIGVVYGDIGTSPLYAVREAVTAAIGPEGTVTEGVVYGILSLIFWALFLVVTLKYIAILLRADNNGEGGTLSLTALIFRALGRGTPFALVLGMVGASMFYGSTLITPALSVLSAVEGLKVVTPAFDALVLPLAIVILVALFLRAVAGHRQGLVPVRADHDGVVPHHCQCGRCPDRRESFRAPGPQSGAWRGVPCRAQDHWPRYPRRGVPRHYRVGGPLQ